MEDEVSDPTRDRLALVNRINHLYFAEYSAVGWFKVVTVGELRGYVSSEQRQVVDQYSRSPGDSGLDQEVIRLFLGDWLVCQCPESIGAFGLDPGEFRPIARTDAIATVEQIIARSLEDPEAAIGGCLDWMTPASPEESTDVPYPQLRSWFVELFADDARYYLHDSPGGPTLRFNLASPRVIALAPGLIGMMWLE
jgi:hypothetical protein